MTTAPEPDELRANLLKADPGVLVAVLAQLTGDPSVIAHGDRVLPGDRELTVLDWSVDVSPPSWAHGR